MLQIRRYRREDQHAVWTLHNTALEQTPGAHAENGPWDEDLRQIESVYLGDGGEFLVGVLAGEIVAMGALKRTNSDVAEIKRMRVHPSHWRQGFGQAMLTTLEKRARELGYTALHLDTTRHQAAAQNLYQKNLYREVRREKAGSFELIFYEKRLVGDVQA